eukprot:768605-Hanusia_phi.AAC.5
MSSQDGVPCLRLDTLSGSSSLSVQNHTSLASTIPTIETPQRRIFSQENLDPEFSRHLSTDRSAVLAASNKKQNVMRPATLTSGSLDDVRNKMFWNCWPGQENEDANSDSRSLSRRGLRSPSPSFQDVHRVRICLHWMVICSGPLLSARRSRFTMTHAQANFTIHFQVAQTPHTLLC